MNEQEPLRILSLLWHPHFDAEVISAGGYRRTFEIFGRMPGGIEVCALDNSPSFLRKVAGGSLRLVEYRIPRPVKWLESRFFLLERIIEWSLSIVLMVFHCLGMKASGESFDVVYLPCSEVEPTSIAGVIAAKLIFRSRLVMCNQNVAIKTATPWVRIAVFLHNRADRIIAVSRDLAQKLASAGMKPRISVNSNGIDTAFIERVVGSIEAPKEYDCVFVGRHTKDKGVYDLVEIWRRVAARMPYAKLVMVGACDPVNAARLSEKIGAYGLIAVVELKGTVADEEKFRIMKRSRVCAFPSYMEGWGIVPQEALACGLPVVLYDLAVYQEHIGACDAVFTVPVGDSGAMAERIIDLLGTGDQGKYENVGPEFVKRYSWDQVASDEFAIVTGNGFRIGA